MRKTNRKGFTLIELLAVIVVLAVVLVLAVPIVLTNMNNAKKKSFQLYGERVLSAVMSSYESDRLLGVEGTKTFTEGGETLRCYTLEDLKLETTGSYQAFVTVKHTDENNFTEYKLYMTDNTYGYDGQTSNEVYNNPELIKVSGIDAIKTKITSNGCKTKP